MQGSHRGKPNQKDRYFKYWFEDAQIPLYIHKLRLFIRRCDVDHCVNLLFMFPEEKPQEVPVNGIDQTQLDRNRNPILVRVPPLQLRFFVVFGGSGVYISFALPKSRICDFNRRAFSAVPPTLQLVPSAPMLLPTLQPPRRARE